MRIDYLHAPTWGRGGIGPRRGVKKLPCSLPLFARQSPFVGCRQLAARVFSPISIQNRIQCTTRGASCYVLSPSPFFHRDRDPVRDHRANVRGFRGRPHIVPLPHRRRN